MFGATGMSAPEAGNEALVIARFGNFVLVFDDGDPWDAASGVTYPAVEGNSRN